MKAIPILIFLVPVLFNARAQNYVINFIGTGGSSTVDSVRVENLTAGTRLTMNGTDTLHLLGFAGIPSGDETSGRVLRIYPNPMTESSIIEFVATSTGKAVVELADVSGKLVLRMQKQWPEGIHAIIVKGLKSGIYILKIRSDGYCYGGNIICESTFTGQASIGSLPDNSGHSFSDHLKNAQSWIIMPYNVGDQLLLTGYSGIFSTVIPLIPVQNQTVPFNFIACTDHDGNNYGSVTIGSQTWMAQNLNVGTRISAAVNQTDNDTLEKFCYNDLDTNCSVYGGLYQWNEVMQYSTTPGVQGICPPGWRLPTEAEIHTLVVYLGGEYEAGWKLKETGLVHWFQYNIYATNSSGFTALPGGFGEPIAYFWGLHDAAYFWSSSSDPWGDGVCLILNGSVGDATLGYAATYDGFSVRCIHN